MQRSAVARRTRALLLAAASVIGVLVTTGTAGYADPSPAPGDIEAQINTAWGQLEPLVEQYNATHEKYLVTQAQVAQLQGQIAPLQKQIDAAMDKVGVISAKQYERGPGSSLAAVLDSGGPTDLLNRLGYLNALARTQTATVADVTRLRDQYARQKQPLDTALASLRQQDAALSTQKGDIQNRITQLNSLRLAAYGNNGGTGSLRPVACPQVYDGSPGAKAASFACKQIGKPYIWADEGPDGYDCSGLTLAAWRSVGVTLPHNALEQKGVTTRVAAADLRVGDLAFYYGDVHHVVIYVGSGWVVSASTYGVPVEMQKLDMNRWNSGGRPR